MSSNNHNNTNPQEMVDGWFDKLGQISGVVLDGAKEKAQQATKDMDTNSIMEKVVDKTKAVTASVVKGVQDGAHVKVSKSTTSAGQSRNRIQEIKTPPKGIYAAAFLSGAAAALGVSRYLISQETTLRTLLRAMSKDWRDDVGDGLIGPVGHMYRPFFSEVETQVHSLENEHAVRTPRGGATPRSTTTTNSFAGGNLVVKAKNWWTAACIVTARPTAGKQLYHGLMAAFHSLSFVVRLRYYRAQSPNYTGVVVDTDKQQQQNSSSIISLDEPDVVEKVAFQITFGLKQLLGGKKPTAFAGKQPEILEDPVTTSIGESVPKIASVSLIGSAALALWHWGNFARCYAQRGGALYAPVRKAVVEPVQNFLHSRVPARVTHILAMIVANAETAALLGETLTAVGASWQLIAPSATRVVSATAALRFASLGKILAVVHRLEDDTEHTLHNYGAMDRQLIYVSAGILALTGVLTPRSCDYPGAWRIFSIAGRAISLSAFSTARSVFSMPRRLPTNLAPGRPIPTTVYDAFASTTVAYGAFFALSLFSSRHRSAHLTGLSVVVAMLYYINTLVKQRDAVIQQQQRAVAAQPAAVAGAPQPVTTPREVPAETSSTTTGAPQSGAEENKKEEKQPAPIPSTDSFERIDHDEDADMVTRANLAEGGLQA